jgi:hypothetical protein
MNELPESDDTDDEEDVVEVMTAEALVHELSLD